MYESDDESKSMTKRVYYHESNNKKVQDFRLKMTIPCHAIRICKVHVCCLKKLFDNKKAVL